MDITNDITTILKEATGGLLQDDSLKAIEEAVNKKVEERVTLAVESALTQQDSEYADQLATFIEAVDKKNAASVDKLVEAIDANHTKYLSKVINKYKRALQTEAVTFKKSLVKQLSKYLEVYLEETIPQNFVESTVLESKAQKVLSNLRKTLAVDSALMKESIVEAVKEGKDQIDESAQQLVEANKRIALLEKNLERSQSEVIFEKKTATLPTKQREYVKKVLQGKTAKFIAENIEYTINLFEQAEQEKTETLREQALKHVVANDDVPVQRNVIVEKVEKNTSSTSKYMPELRKY